LLSKSPYDAGKDADFNGGIKSAPTHNHVKLRKYGILEHLLLLLLLLLLGRIKLRNKAL
jgi:hypothetical protein